MTKATTAADGSFEFDPELLYGGERLLIYVDDAAYPVNMVGVVRSSDNVLGLSLSKDVLSVGNNHANLLTSYTNADFAAAYLPGNSNVHYLVSGNDVNFLNGINMVVPSLVTYAPGGDMDVTGDLQVLGALNMQGHSITEAGSWSFDNISNLGEVTLTGSGKTITSGISGLNQFGKLTISGAYSLADALHVNGALDVAGTLDAAGNAMTLAQSLDLTNISNAGDVTLDGTGSITSFGKSVNTLAISGLYSLVDALDVNGALTVTGTLDAASKGMTLAQSLDLTKISNVLDVTLDGSGTLTSDSKELNNLTVSGAYSLADALHVNGALNVSGTLDAADNAMTLAQRLDLTKISNARDVTLEGSGTLFLSGKTVHDLTIYGAYSLTHTLRVSGVLSVPGTLDAANRMMILQQSLDLTNISNAKDVMLEGSGSLKSAGKELNDLSILGSYSLADALHVNGTLDMAGTLDAGSNGITLAESLDLTSITNAQNVTLDGSGTLKSASKELNNLTISGIYSLVDALHVNGALDVAGTLDAGSNAMTLAQSLDLTKISNARDVTLDGAGTLTLASKELNDLAILGAYSLVDAIHVNGALSVTGTLNAATKAMTLAQSLDLTNISNARDVTLDGAGTLTSASKELNDLAISGVYSLVDALHVNGALNVSGTLDGASKAMTLAQSLDLTKISNAGDVTLDGAGSITSAGKSMNSLAISGAYSLVGALAVIGELNVTGTLNAASQAIREGGHWSFNGLSNVGDVTLTGSGKTITSGVNQFGKLTISGVYSLADALHVNGALDVTGDLDAANKAMTLAQGLDLTNISSAGNVTLDGSGSITSDGKAVAGLVISGAYSLVDALSVIGDLDVQGTLNAASNAIREGGHWSFNGLSNVGDVTLTGSGKMITSGPNQFGNLTISGVYSLVDALHVNGALNVTGALEAASKAMTLAGSLDLTNISGARDVVLEGSGAIISSGKAINDLTVLGTYSFGDAMNVAGDLTLTNGTLTQGAGLAIAGDYIQTSGTFMDTDPLSHTFTVTGNFSVPYGVSFIRYTGNGAANNPYVIRNIYDLQAMKNNLSSHFKLNSSLDLSGAASWNGNAGFEPIGTLGSAFTGSLNGNGQVISNLTMNHSAAYSGLFGYVTGAVNRLGLENVNISGGQYTGGLAGFNAGVLTNVYTTGSHTVSGVSFVGGLVGANTGSIANAYSSARVAGTGEHVGGLAGQNNGTVNKTYAMGYVTGATNTGGLVGSGTGTVTNSFWDKKMTGQTTSVGGGTAGKAVLMAADAQGFAVEDPETALDATSANMMSSTTYSGWDFSNTWVMDEGGTYPHFQFRYGNGVRGVGGHVYLITSLDGVTTQSGAGAGQNVNLYYSNDGVTESSLNYSIGTGASSRYYGVLDRSSVGNSTLVIAKSLNGSSKMAAGTRSIYPLDVFGSQSRTLVQPVVPTIIVVTPPPTGGTGVDTTLIIPPTTIIPTVVTTIPIVTIVDQTGIGNTNLNQNLIGGVPSTPVTNPLGLPLQPVTLPVSELHSPVIDSATQNRTDNAAQMAVEDTLDEADVSFEEESPLGREPVPVKNESVETKSSEIVGGDKKGSGTEETEASGKKEEVTPDKDGGKDVQWRDVPIEKFMGGEDSKKFLTDVRVIEGAVYVIDGANAMSLLGMGDSMRVLFKKRPKKQIKALKEPVVQTMKQPLGDILKKADPESDLVPMTVSREPTPVALNQALEKILKKTQEEPEVAPSPETRVLKSASPIVTQHTKSGDRYGTLKNPGKDVFVKSRGGEWKSAIDGMVILPGDEVKTAERNSVEVLMDGGKIGRVEIKEGSLFRIQKAETDTVTGDRTTILDLALGKILVKVEALKGNSKFEVRTPTALTGVRGTLFEVTVKEKS
ncbi:MAG: FecR domain-containing protein [Candidatus Omnitrophota bacterium]